MEKDFDVKNKYQKVPASDSHVFDCSQVELFRRHRNSLAPSLHLAFFFVLVQTRCGQHKSQGCELCRITVAHTLDSAARRQLSSHVLQQFAFAAAAACTSQPWKSFLQLLWNQHEPWSKLLI